MNKETKEGMENWIKEFSSTNGNLRIGISIIMKAMLEKDVKGVLNDE